MRRRPAAPPAPEATSAAHAGPLKLSAVCKIRGYPLTRACSSAAAFTPQEQRRARASSTRGLILRRQQYGAERCKTGGSRRGRADHLNTWLHRGSRQRTQVRISKVAGRSASAHLWFQLGRCEGAEQQHGQVHQRSQRFPKQARCKRAVLLISRPFAARVT